MTDAAHKPSILIVDDDEVFRDAARARVRRPRLRRAHRRRLRRRAWRSARATRPSSRSSTYDAGHARARAGAGAARASIRRPRSSCSPATAASRPRSTRCGSARPTTCRSRPTPTTSSPRSRAARRRRSSRRRPIDYTAPSLARAEWEHINRVLSDCGGNISEAARRLGIHRRIAAAQAAEVSAEQVAATSAPRASSCTRDPRSAGRSARPSRRAGTCRRRCTCACRSRRPRSCPRAASPARA